MFEGQIMGEILDGDIRKIGLMMTGTRLEDIPDEDPAAVSQAETPEK